MSITRVLFVPIVFVILLVGSLAGCQKKVDDGKKIADKRSSKQAVTVQVTAVAAKSFERKLELEGTLEPAERVLVAPTVPGIIRQVTKRAGDRIKKGELLVTVDPKEVYVGTIELRVHLATAQAKGRAASAVLARLDAPLARLRRLHKAQAISRTELDKVEIPYVQAQAERDAARSVVRRVQRELGVAYSKLGDTKLHAPFDGFVVRRLADPGEAARPFPPTVVLVITKHDPLYVQAEVNEEDIGRLRKKQPVRVRCDAMAGQPPLAGELEDIIPYVNPMSRTATIRVRVPNPSGRMMPGMSASVALTLAPRELLALPRSALASAPLDSRASVFVVGPDGKAHERRIRFGRAHGDWLTVLDGLSAGERVVSRGHERLFDGFRVLITTPPTVAASLAR